MNRPRRRPPAEDYDREEIPARDPRRRTPYVPRQGSAQASHRSYRDDVDDVPVTSRYQPQQPHYRPSRDEPIDEYGDEVDGNTYVNYTEVDEYDDRVIDDDRSFAPPRGRREARPPARRTASRSRSRRDDAALDDEYVEDDYDRFDDGFIDEDDWYEEEAAAGGYRPRQRASRGARSRPRPSVSVPRPSLPRPTMPLAVKEAALVQDRVSLVLAGALMLGVAAMALVAMNRIDSLAPGFPTHVSASGIAEDFRSETALWQLPLMAGALLLMNTVLAWFLAGFSGFPARLLLVSSVIVQALIWVALIRIAF